MSIQYIVPANKVSRVNLAELDPLIETEIGYAVSVNFIGQYLIIEGVSVGDESTVILLIDDYLKDEEPEPEVPTTQVIATGLDIRSLDRTRDSISIHDGGNVISVDGTVSLDPASLAALEFVNATIQEDATIDVNKIKGELIDTGSGNVGPGTLRVVIASNNPAIAVGATQVGNWEFRRVVASGSLYSGNISSSVALESSRVAKSTAGIIFNVIGYNAGPEQFIHIYNSAAVPASGAIPVVVQKVATGSNFEIQFGSDGIYLTDGVCVGNSTTLATRTAGALDCFFSVSYK